MRIADSGRKWLNVTHRKVPDTLFTILWLDWYSTKDAKLSWPWDHGDTRDVRSAHSRLPIVRCLGKPAPLTRISVCKPIRQMRYSKFHTITLIWHWHTIGLYPRITIVRWYKYIWINPTCRYYRTFWPAATTWKSKNAELQEPFIPVFLVFTHILCIRIVWTV